jgi:hypothetical protein
MIYKMPLFFFDFTSKMDHFSTRPKRTLLTCKLRHILYILIDLDEIYNLVPICHRVIRHAPLGWGVQVAHPEGRAIKFRIKTPDA